LNLTFINDIDLIVKKNKFKYDYDYDYVEDNYNINNTFLNKEKMHNPKNDICYIKINMTLYNETREREEKKEKEIDDKNENNDISNNKDNDNRINTNLLKSKIFIKKLKGNSTINENNKIWETKEDNEVRLNNELKLFLNNQIKDLQIKKKKENNNCNNNNDINQNKNKNKLKITNDYKYDEIIHSNIKKKDLIELNTNLSINFTDSGNKTKTLFNRSRIINRNLRDDIDNKIHDRYNIKRMKNFSDKPIKSLNSNEITLKNISNELDFNLSFISKNYKINNFSNINITNMNNSNNHSYNSNSISKNFLSNKYPLKDFHIIFEFKNQTIGKNHFSEEKLLMKQTQIQTNEKNNKTNINNKNINNNITENQIYSNINFSLKNNTTHKHLNNSQIIPNLNISNNNPRNFNELNISMIMKEKDNEENSSGYSIVIYKITFPEEEDFNTISYILGLQRDENNFVKICNQCLDNSLHLKRLLLEIYDIQKDMISFSNKSNITRQELIIKFSEYINRVNMIKIHLLELNSNLDLLKAVSCPNYEDNLNNFDSIMKKTNTLIEIIQNSIRKQNLNINFIIIN
jgi:hypothetical protein